MVKRRDEVLAEIKAHHLVYTQAKRNVEQAERGKQLFHAQQAGLQQQGGVLTPQSRRDDVLAKLQGLVSQLAEAGLDSINLMQAASAIKTQLDQAVDAEVIEEDEPDKSWGYRS